jgi:hypothetical protein
MLMLPRLVQSLVRTLNSDGVGLPWVREVWTAIYNAPILAPSDCDNTTVLGNTLLPIYVASRASVIG